MVATDGRKAWLAALIVQFQSSGGASPHLQPSALDCEGIRRTSGDALPFGLRVG